MDGEKTLKYASSTVNMPLLEFQSFVLHGSLDRVFDTLRGSHDILKAMILLN